MFPYYVFLFILIYYIFKFLNFFSQQDPVDNRTWYWRVILGKYYIIIIIKYLIIIIIIYRCIPRGGQCSQKQGI